MIEEKERRYWERRGVGKERNDWKEEEEEEQIRRWNRRRGR